MKEIKQEIGTIELVVFKVKSDFSEKEVVEAAEAINPIIEKYDGFVSRKLAISGDDIWTY